LVDLEFWLQYLVLRDAHLQPAWLSPRSTRALLEVAYASGVLEAQTHAALQQAHAVLLDAGLRCTLDRRPRRVVRTPAIEAARACVREVTTALFAAGSDQT
jgi:glutamate-ammonia-ligase adenylyltransferase